MTHFANSHNLNTWPETIQSVFHTTITSPEAMSEKIITTDWKHSLKQLNR